MKKEPGETNFLGLLWESFFRDNVLVLRGTSSRDVIVLPKTTSLSHDFVRPSSSNYFLKKAQKSGAFLKIRLQINFKMKKEPGETNFLGLLWES